MSEHTAEFDAGSRALLVEDYASFWWSQETGETDAWGDLDVEERQAVFENSYAETVVDWLATRVTPPGVRAGSRTGRDDDRA